MPEPEVNASGRPPLVRALRRGVLSISWHSVLGSSSRAASFSDNSLGAMAVTRVCSPWSIAPRLKRLLSAQAVREPPGSSGESRFGGHPVGVAT